MDHDTIKLTTPVLLLAVWLVFAWRTRSFRTACAGLLFASYAACSSNFAFVYRNVHQAIELALFAIVAWHALKHGAIHRVNGFFFALLVLVGISLVGREIDDDVLEQLVNLGTIVAVTNFLFVALNTRERVAVALGLVGTLCTVLSLVCLVEFWSDPDERVVASFANPNYLGFFLGIGSCVVAAHGRSRLRWAQWALIVAAIALTGSRSAIAFPVAQLVWTLWHKLQLKNAIAVGVALVAIGAAVLLAGADRMVDAEATNSSDAERLAFAAAAYRMAVDHPFTGVGWGRFVAESESYLTFGKQYWIGDSAVEITDIERRVSHNDFLRVLAELGWIAFGLCIVATAYGALVVFGRRNVLPDYWLPLWFGTLLFSLSHNNLSSPLAWFVLLYPILARWARLSDAPQASSPTDLVTRSRFISARSLMSR